ncbi:Putative DNA-binding domain-containing protein [Sphingobium sp. YR657]|uniref:AlbA family DNA-binding domain-containing protein n=1 Tax=Sphingobium TaxID=165695 RepID=UPI000918FCFF|nr:MULTISPECIES: ATP-binding protein [Sphingobium]SHM73241.1 Putative DNA-binding domain-containing protein [Sphingobium sp. YR657]
MAKRSITDEEIGLIKAMLARGMANKDIQFYFNRQDRAVNSGRISGIKSGDYGPEVACASNAQLDQFLEAFVSAELSAPTMVAVATPAEPPDAMDGAVLRSFFRKDKAANWYCIVGETDQHECKENFNLRRFGKPLKTIAGFANHRGGYLFFGVRDKPHDFVVCGLADDRFSATDQNSFSQTIRSVLEPTPRFRIATICLDGLTVGIVHVEPHTAKPVIASKSEGEVAEGAIYYRYPGETRSICYPDLRAILDERDQQTRNAIIPMVERLIELGPKHAMVANLADGQLEGGNRPILIEPQSLERIKFIREGEFDEVRGAPTLRLIGDAQAVASEVLMPVRTVREEVTVDAILRNFLGRSPVEQPLSYFSQVSHEQGWILPVFYYLHLAGQTRKDAIASLASSKHAKPKTRQELIRLLQGKRSLFQKTAGGRAVTLNLIRSGLLLPIADLEGACAVADALAGITQDDEANFDLFHSLLSECRTIWETHHDNGRLLSRIRRAAARLDELEYGPLVPSE